MDHCAEREPDARRVPRDRSRVPRSSRCPYCSLGCHAACALSGCVPALCHLPCQAADRARPVLSGRRLPLTGPWPRVEVGGHLVCGDWAWVCCRDPAAAVTVGWLVPGRVGASRPARAPASASAAQIPSAGPYPAPNAWGEAYDPWPANTATASAIPSAPPRWRTMVKVPDALPLCWGAMWLGTELCAAGIAAENPRPVSTNGTSSCQ